MKRYYSLLIAACLLSACDDWTEKNFDIENQVKPENVITKEYTLTDDDYATIASLKIEGVNEAALSAVKKNKYLTVQTPADLVLPAFMAKKYYSASEGAMITTTYLMAAESPEYLAAMEAASSYTVSEEDYATVWGNEEIPYFTPAKNAEANLPVILKTALPDAEEKDYAVVSYAYSPAEPNQATEEKEVVLLEETFEAGMGDFTLQNTVLPEGLTYVWKHDSKYKYMKASAYANKTKHTAESWLISPAVDMSAATAATLIFDHVSKNGKADNSDLTLWVSKNYTDGKPDAANWSQVTIPSYSSGEDWNFVSSGEISLKDFAGNQNVHFAFKYTSDATAAGTWEIKNVVLNGLVKASAVKAVTKAADFTETRYAFYQYNGKAWAEVKGAAIASPADYEAMGSSKPNFSATFAADDYLPAFMKQKFPYAQEGDIKTAVYHYYADNKTSLRADDYLYNAGVWMKNNIPVDSVVSRCIYRGGKWLVAPDAIFSQDFEAVGSTSPADVPGWTAISVKGNKWYTSLYNGNTYARCTGHNGGGVTEAWLITPAIELPTGYELQLTFDCEVGYFTESCLSVLISTDFSGDQAAATWVDITDKFVLPTAPTSGYGKFANVGGFDLADYLGQTVYVAFRLDGDSDKNRTTTYDIDNVTVGVVF